MNPNPIFTLILVLLVFSAVLSAQRTDFNNAIITEEVVFTGADGIVAVEAEHFYKQSNSDIRQWYRTSKNELPVAGRDEDDQHCPGASNNAYIEILPDTRVTHSDELINQENFCGQPGKMAVVHYKVNISIPGRYYVWVRAYSTGTEDNSIHVGFDGVWPEHGQRMQWCEGKNEWTWASKQRTDEVHCGVPKEIYLDIDKAGVHDIQFSMREDGFEFDKFILTSDIDYVPEGKGDVHLSGELKRWHKVTLTLDGPFASETDQAPNPFTDYRMAVRFTHESGAPSYEVPAYFAADGNAAESSATGGNKWRAHLSPDKTGKWNYHISFLKGTMVATADMPWMKPLLPFDGIEGSFEVEESDKTGRDFRAAGRLEYVGKHHLQWKGTGAYFYKAGADAPETLLAYEDFDNTITKKNKVPVKQYRAHLQDYHTGDPTWKAGRGKGLIGAINYLSGKGVNAISFLTYNAGGDGDNVWPFVSRNEKYNYDCSKLDQWQIVFDHAQSKGIHLNFKTQETENDDNQTKEAQIVPESLDGGDLGPERRLYYRELIARYGYLLALNWNLGEENTQSTENQIAMAEYFFTTDPYHHNVVLHTYPNQQEKVYTPLLGKNAELTGLSLQNSWESVFTQTLKWVNESDAAGKPWVVANDEQNAASLGVPPDPGYQGFDASTVEYDLHDIRKQTLWGNIMAGGAGVEYYFGYKLPENDLIMEDFRSRDKSWDYCRIAIEFLADHRIPFQDMKNADALIGNANMDKEKHCLAKTGEIYLVQLAYTHTTTLDLNGISGDFTVRWFNPVQGGKLEKGSIKTVKGDQVVSLGKAPSALDQDWIVIVRKTNE